MIDTIARPLRESFDAHRRFVLVSYGIAVVVCVVMAAAPYLVGFTPLFMYADIGQFQGGLAGAATALSAFFLASTGVLFVVIGRQLAIVRAERRNRWWYLIGCAFVFLALDELLMWHERLTARMEAWDVARAFGFADQDAYIFIAYGLFAALVGSRLLPTISTSRLTILPLIVAVTLFVLSTLVDLVPWSSLSRNQRGVLGPLEEGLKTLGSWSSLMYAVLLLEDVIGWPHQAQVVTRGQRRLKD